MYVQCTYIMCHHVLKSYGVTSYIIAKSAFPNSTYIKVLIVPKYILFKSRVMSNIYNLCTCT